MWKLLYMLTWAVAGVYARARLQTHTGDYYYGLVIPPADEIDQLNLNQLVYDHYAQGAEINGAHDPPLVDYTSFMLPVKDQGKCGSCYSFSSISVLEALVNRASIATHHMPVHIPLSVGEIVDCSYVTGDHGCDGGWPVAVFAYIKMHGVCPAKQYKYKPAYEFCRLNACSREERQYIHSYGIIKPSSHRDLATALDIHGPLVVGVDASNLHLYTSGLFTNCSSTPDINHAVALVGLVEKNGTLAFKIQNSWGTSFGEDGFFYVPYHGLDTLKNDCGLTTSVAFASV